MTFKEEIELQSRDNKMLSYEILSQLKEKNYYSGKPKQIGDTVLFGMVQVMEEGDEMFTKLITFHEEEIGVLYGEDVESYTRKKSDKLPRLKKIENGN